MSDPIWIYPFDASLPDQTDERALLGGKGAGLRQMTAAGLPVPPGFTITTEACEAYYRAGRTWPPGLQEQIRAQMTRLEELTGRRFAEGDPPLLVSVRSGAAQSMPGMMDTLLNCGVHPGMVNKTANPHACRKLWAEFVIAFVKTLYQPNPAQLEQLRSIQVDSEKGGRTLQETADRIISEVLAAQQTSAASAPQQRSSLDGEHRLPARLPTEPWALLEASISAVFDSWEGERARVYRRRHGIRGLNGTAVNVQAMFPSQVSGVAFTQDPNAPNANRMIIEASFGLGEAVVSGDVTPDRFVVSRAVKAVERTIGRKGHAVRSWGDREDQDADEITLTESMLHELVALAGKVEDFYGHPVDLEWGWADGRFAMLQARPIKGLQAAMEAETARDQERERLRQLAGTARRLWVSHNLGETLIHPTPLTWDVIRRFMSGTGGFGRLYRGLGYRPSAEIDRDGFLELICGRIYADTDRMPGLFFDGLPMAYDLGDTENPASLIDRAPSRFDASRADTRFLTQLPANLAAMVRISRRIASGCRSAQEQFEKHDLPPFLRWVEQQRAVKLDGLGLAELKDVLEQRRAKVMDEFAPCSLRPGFFGSMAFDRLASLLELPAGPEEASQWLTNLTRGLEGDLTFQQDAMLYEVAQGRQPMKAFLSQFGHRCAGEMELMRPRWQEQPELLEPVLRPMTAGGRNPAELHEQNVAARTEAERKLPEALVSWGAGSLLDRVQQALTDCQKLLPYRESGKHYLMMGYCLIREAIMAIGARLGLHDDVFFLQWSELMELTESAADSKRDVIAARKLRIEAQRRIDLPATIDSNQLDDFGRTPVVHAGRNIEGTAIAAGMATGPVRLVRSPDEAQELGEGYILVCPSTDPGWTPLFLNAAGLVVERGGVLSHGAIVARDFGIPAVVIPDAMRLLRADQQVRIDGQQGRLYLLDAAEEQPPVTTKPTGTGVTRA